MTKTQLCDTHDIPPKFPLTLNKKGIPILRLNTPKMGLSTPEKKLHAAPTHWYMYNECQNNHPVVLKMIL